MGNYYSKACESFCDDIEDGFLNKKMVVLAGPVGTMKSSLFELCANNQESICEFIYVSNLFKERVNIASIMNAIIYSLSDESPKRDLEARTMQLRRVLGETVVNNKKTVVVVIEEAHRLHNSIFRAIKELREMTYKGSKNLFSVVLIGHPSLITNVETRKEALWRSTIIEMNERNGWMTFGERVNYIKEVFGKSITPEAGKTIAIICKVPLQIVDYVEKKMTEARKAGKSVIDEDVVKPTIGEQMQAYNLSVRMVAQEANLGVATVHSTLNVTNKFTPRVQAAINRLAQTTEQKKRSA
jgi:type II secretory pathway predicted ATPase ExeA